MELTSLRRDRTRFAGTTADFEVMLSESGSKDRFSALDPVSDAAPLLIFDTNFDAGGGASVTGVVDGFTALTFGAITSNTEIVGQFAAGDLLRGPNFYTGAVLNNTTKSEVRRITKYRFLGSSGGNDYGLFTVETPFVTAVDEADAIEINNPTDITDTSFPVFFAAEGSSIDNFYRGMILYNQDLNQFRTIIEYRAKERLVFVDATPAVAGWTTAHTYIIRQEAPSETGTLAGSTATTFTLPVTSSAQDDFYVGSFIRITSGGAQNDMRRIVDYVGATRTGTVSPAFSAVPGAATYEILRFSRDNVTPLAYSGSKVSQQQSTSYRIELMSLSLPTAPLRTGVNINNLSHVYVELTNLSSASAGVSNVIYSNNPSARQAIFRATIVSASQSPFVALIGDKAVQTVQFKPNDNFRLTVRLPDGQVFAPLALDNASPLPPNPFLQVSALFSVQRL